VVFAGEPLIRIAAPIIEAQIVETFLLATVNHQTLVATKAARRARRVYRGPGNPGRRTGRIPGVGALLGRVLRSGRLDGPMPDLSAAGRRASSQLDSLPGRYKRLEDAAVFRVRFSSQLSANR